MSRAENTKVVRAQVFEAIVRAAAQGLALSELRLLLPGVKRSTLYSALAALREAGRIHTISRRPVALNFAADVPLQDASSSFRVRYPALKAEIANAISLGFHASAKAAARRSDGRPAGAKDRKPRRRATARERLDHLQSNRVARTVRGDGTHAPESTKPAITITWPEGLKPTICPPVRGRFDRLASTGDSGVAPQVGRYSEPASSWASAVLALQERQA